MQSINGGGSSFAVSPKKNPHPKMCGATGMPAETHETHSSKYVRYSWSSFSKVCGSFTAGDDEIRNLQPSSVDKINNLNFDLLALVLVVVVVVLAKKERQGAPFRFIV